MRVRVLDEAQLAKFHCDGFLLLEGFYDRNKEIEPIQEAIQRILELVAARHNIEYPVEPFTAARFDQLYAKLIACDRSYGSEVYDAIKQIPSFVRLVASEKHEVLFRQLRGTGAPGVAAGGFGIRIDNPGEERFRADWHQEYPSQLRSLDGLVFWAPLVDVPPEAGPVRICIGSHRAGPIPVHECDPEHPEKTGAYGLVLKDRDVLVERYPHIAPVTRPGDLIVMDFLTIHSSGFNQSNRARWTMQSRWFNFRDPTGLRIGWRGSFAAGVRFADVHPELVAKP